MRLNNNIISIEVAEHGAELLSLFKDGREFMWNGDPAFWNRHAPILFPAVGKPCNNEIRIDGKVYTMKQHGFARDSEFMPIEEGVLRLIHTDRHEQYPYCFALEVEYSLVGSSVEVTWTVTNLDEKEMHFQIGAHPGFLLPDYNETDAVHGYVRYYDKTGNTVSPVITSALEDGNRVPLMEPIRIPSMMPIAADTFAHDALIFEEGQVAVAELLDNQGRHVVSVSCQQAEAFGIWAPYKPGCPFICLEPWCGICDEKGFSGDISERTYSHHLAPGGSYRFAYNIAFF